MEKPKHNSSIQEKIKWLEWFINNVSDEEKLQMTTVTENNRNRGIYRPRQSTKIPLSDEEKKQRKKAAGLKYATKQKEAKIAAYGESKRGRKTIYTPEEVKARCRERNRLHYYKRKAQKENLSE